jgi:hypothetical protein
MIVKDSPRLKSFIAVRVNVRPNRPHKASKIILMVAAWSFFVVATGAKSGCGKIKKRA